MVDIIVRVGLGLFLAGLGWIRDQLFKPVTDPAFLYDCEARLRALSNSTPRPKGGKVGWDHFSCTEIMLQSAVSSADFYPI